MDIFEIHLPPAERTENVGKKKEKVSMKSKSFRLVVSWAELLTETNVNWVDWVQFYFRGIRIKKFKFFMIFQRYLFQRREKKYSIWLRKC